MRTPPNHYPPAVHFEPTSNTAVSFDTSQPYETAAARTRGLRTRETARMSKSWRTARQDHNPRRTRLKVTLEMLISPKLRLDGNGTGFSVEVTAEAPLVLH